MADQRITELTELLANEVAATDVLPIADLTASETKKLTVKNLIEDGLALIDDESIPNAKLKDQSVDSNTYGAGDKGVPTIVVNKKGIVTSISTDQSPTFKNTVTFEGHGVFNNDRRAKFGTENDERMEIYWNTNGIFSNKAGQLKIQSNDLKLRGDADNKSFLSAKVNEGTIIYHSGDQRLETTVDGVSISGECKATTLDINGASSLASDNFQIDANGRVLISNLGSSFQADPIVHIQFEKDKCILLNNNSIGVSQTDGTYISNRSDGEFHIINQENKSFSLGTNNQIQVTIGPAGQIGIGDGPDYGEDGQFLRSNGDGSAASWGDVPGGGTDNATDKIASGTTKVQTKNDHILFDVDSTEVMRLTNSDHLGLGTESPGRRLHVLHDSDDTVALFESGDPNCYVEFKDNNTSSNSNPKIGAVGDNLTVVTSNNERFRVDGNGRVLIGHFAAKTAAARDPFFAVEGTADNDTAIRITRNSGDDHGPALIFSKSRSTSLNGNKKVSENDLLGDVVFAAADGGDHGSIAGRIECKVDGSTSTNDIPGRLVFLTARDGANNTTEAMRIDSKQRVIAKAAAIAEIVTLDSQLNVTPDFAKACNFEIELEHNVRLENPQNCVAGQSGSIFITQNSSIAKTLTFGGYWDFANGGTPQISSTIGAVDRLDYIVRNSQSIHAVLTTNYS